MATNTLGSIDTSKLQDLFTWQNSTGIEGFPPRVNLASAYDPKNRIIYASGGFYVDHKLAKKINPLVEKCIDIFQLKLNSISPKWELIYPCNSQFDISLHTIPRHGHEMVFFKDKLYLIGGNYNENVYHICPILSIFDLSTFKWDESRKQRGDIPYERDTHTIAHSGDKIYLHGGIERNDHSTCPGFSNELFQLDIPTLTWLKLPSDGVADKLHLMFHSLSYFKERLYVFGGEFSKEYFGIYRYKDDVYYYDLQICKWIQAKTIGTPPAPRRSHMTEVYKEHLIVFGGACRTLKSYYNDLFLFNLNTHTWTEVIPWGLCPSARRRCGHYLVGDSIFYFGGIGPTQAAIEKNAIDRTFCDPNNDNLIDISETIILSLTPTLRTYCYRVIIKCKLNETKVFEMLPAILKSEIRLLHEHMFNIARYKNVVGNENDHYTRSVM